MYQVSIAHTLHLHWADLIDACAALLDGCVGQQLSLASSCCVRALQTVLDGVGAAMLLRVRETLIKAFNQVIWFIHKLH
jgi:hypothetical protein